MKNILLFFAAFFIFKELSAQCDSTFFEYTGTGINDVSLVDTNKMMGVGDHGYIVKTTDGGRRWTVVHIQPLDVLLKGIQMVSDTIGYSIGAWKTVLKTEDQGETWFPLYTNTASGSADASTSLNDLFFFNNNKGFIVGDNGRLLSTTNGGRTWKDTIFNSSERLNSITFLNNDIGFICGSSTSLYKTINGGRSWQKITVPFLNSFQMFTKVRFINSVIGFVIGRDGVCIKTENAGATWTATNTNRSDHFRDIYFNSPMKGFMVGSSGIVLTSDGGNTWEPNYNYQTRYNSYNNINADPFHRKIIFAGGGSSTSSGYNGRTILSTIDSGITFTSVSSNGSLDYNDIFFINDSTGYIAGEDGAVFKTSSYGETWTPLDNVPAMFNGHHARKLFFLDSLHGFVSSDNIYKTSNGGKTWIRLTTPGTLIQYTPIQIYFYDTLKGLVQDRETIYKTADGGITWTKVAAEFLFRDFTVAANGKAFAVGYGGKLIVSIDEGSTWSSVDLNTTKDLLSVYFVTAEIGFIGTTDGEIYKTIDGGTTWQNVYFLKNSGISSFLFQNPSEGYMASGGLTEIYKTKDGGLTWFLVKVPHGNFPRLAGFKTIYSAGADGLILRTAKLQIPGMPGYIYGPDKSCINERSAFITADNPTVSYRWSLAGGGTNTYSTNTDTVSWNAAGLHTLSVTASNACGTGPSRQIAIDVINFEPVITVTDSLLTASEGKSYYWFRNGIRYPDATDTSRSIVPRLSGAYTVQVENIYGCTVTTAPVNYRAPAMVITVCPNGYAFIPSDFYTYSYQWQMDDGSGFVNITDNANFSGTTLHSLQLANAPSSWYGYRFRCNTSAGTSDVYVLQFVDNWIGFSDSNWENPDNWSCGRLPDTNTDVLVEKGTITVNSNVVIRKLIVNPGVNLTVQPGHTLTITH